MDFVNSLTGGNNKNDNQQSSSSSGNQAQGESQSGGGWMDGLKNKINSAAGGGRESEKDEDLLDK